MPKGMDGVEKQVLVINTKRALIDLNTGDVTATGAVAHGNDTLSEGWGTPATPPQEVMPERVVQDNG
ncbi:MAG: hypothetical protein ACLTZT_05925 [Butyricimonas faecalis]